MMTPSGSNSHHTGWLLPNPQITELLNRKDMLGLGDRVNQMLYLLLLPTTVYELQI